jgi:hypothetical protein
MNFIRTFHPVGQGAFYTERHKAIENQFTIVYDCGSLSKGWKKILKKEIERTFHENPKIDVLFISHFHDDHVNGIKFLKEHCNIERVVMPLVDDKAKVLLTVSALMTGNVSILPLIDDPQKFFGSIPIVTIENFLPEEQENNAMNRQLESLSDKESCKRTSGTRFILDPKIDDWYYIPYNIHDETNAKRFFEALRMSYTDIDTVEKIKKHWDKIDTAYRTIFKNSKELNANSMVLFSGKNTEDTITCSGHCPSKGIKNSGCLYTGDVDLKIPGLVDALKDKLGTLYSHIGTLQVPHHGSKNNYDGSILKDSGIECAVASYGINNSYGHPSEEVINEIISSGVDVHRITECSYVLQKK